MDMGIRGQRCPHGFAPYPTLPSDTPYPSSEPPLPTSLVLSRGQY